MIVKEKVVSESEQWTVGHKVILTERDLLLLERVLSSYTPNGLGRHELSEHVVDMFTKVRGMLADY